ncbi:hypothetical protein LCGC14_2795460 [marine sediment metagenome]|uniref:Uncharacterized protein n=1 Tax=marine sediment metagenome TaxID=412755 RepID=A0A0F8YP69_9ZZZZ
MSTRCSNCFQERQGITPAYPNTPPICRGCARAIDGAVGWLETHGYGILELATGEVFGGASLGVSPPTPQTLSSGAVEPGDAVEKAKAIVHTE